MAQPLLLARGVTKNISIQRINNINALINIFIVILLVYLNKVIVYIYTEKKTKYWKKIHLRRFKIEFISRNRKILVKKHYFAY